MAAKNRASGKTMGSELRALRDQRLASGPVSEAARREASFLRNVTGAGDDLEWILLNQAWTHLDFERVGDWWQQRVLPVLEKLDLRPSARLAERVIAAIQADEAVLPAAQRRTQREIASIARTSQSTVSRSLGDSRKSGSDLGGAKSPLVDALRGEIEAVEAAQDSAAATADTPTEPVFAGLGGEPAGADQAEVLAGTQTPVDGPDMTPTGEAAASASSPAGAEIAPVPVGAADSPAADPMAPPSPQQPGQDSPTDHDREDSAALAESSTAVGRSETSLHLPHGGVGGEAPGEPRPPVEPVELEGGGILPPSSSSAPWPYLVRPSFAGGDIADVLWLFREIERSVDEVDPDVIGPLLTTAEIACMHDAADRVAQVVGLVERWQTT